MTVPPELIREVLLHLPLGSKFEPPSKSTSSTLASCALVSKEFLLEARPLLYETVKIVERSPDPGDGPQVASRFDTTLQANPNLAALIKYVTIEFETPVHSRDAPGHMEYDSPSLSSLLPRLNSLHGLAFDCLRSMRRGGKPLLWFLASDPLKSAIAQALVENKESLQELRLSSFGIPPPLYLQLPSISSLYVYRTPGTRQINEETLPIRAKISNFECFSSLYEHLRDGSLSATTTATLSLCPNYLRVPRNGLREFLDATNHTLRKLKIYLSAGSQLSLEHEIPHMRELTDLELHWELTETFLGIDPPPDVSGLVTFVVPLLEGFLKYDTLKNVSFHLLRRCELRSSASASEEILAAPLIERAFLRSLNTTTKLRSVVMHIKHVCPAGGCEKCSEFDQVPGQGIFNGLLKLTKIRQKFTFSYTHTRLASHPYLMHLTS